MGTHDHEDRHPRSPATAATAAANVVFSRTVDSSAGVKGTLTFNEGCAKTDSWGSNDCTWKWGDTIGLAYDLTSAETISGGTISIDAKVDSIIPFSASCPACGANCTVKIPVIGKTETFAMPPCPILSKGEHLKNSTTLALPSKSPIPAKTGVKGSITLKDQTGAQVVKLDVDATIAPGESALRTIFTNIV